MKLPCKQHPGENYVTYCNTCQEPCCPKCIPSSHDTHVFSELGVAARDTRGHLTRFKEILRNRKKLKDSVEQRLMKRKEDAEKQKKAVRERCESLRKSINDIE